jgi:protein TonB
MASMDQNRFMFPAWGISLTLHALVAGLAFIFAAQVTPFLPEEVFQWDVALIESTSSQSNAEQLASVQKSEPLPAKKTVAARTKSVPDAPQPAMGFTPIEQKIEQVPLSQEKAEMPQPLVEPMEQRLVEMTAPAAEPFIDAKEPTPQPVSEEPVAVASTPATSSDVAPFQEPSVERSSPPRSEEIAPAQGAKASPSGSEMKADHRWLAESLWRRVAELKRYPSSARMSGQEGKVILKAVIRSDGHLADVWIQRSSGHELLDAAAIEAVKLACPLHMKHALDKPQIVVSLPIVYSLLTP